MAENLVTIIALTKVEQWLGWSDPVISELKTQIEKDYQNYENLHPFLKGKNSLTRRYFTQRIYNKIIRLAKNGIKSKANEYARIFDKKFELENLFYR
jgi:hypothetical protein